MTIILLCKETLCYIAGSELDELFSTFQQQQVVAVPDYLQGEIILQSDWSIAGSTITYVYHLELKLQFMTMKHYKAVLRLFAYAWNM